MFCNNGLQIRLTIDSLSNFDCDCACSSMINVIPFKRSFTDNLWVGNIFTYLVVTNQNCGTVLFFGNKFKRNGFDIRDDFNWVSE